MNLAFTNLLWIIGASQGFLLAFFLLLKKDWKLNFPLILFIFFTSAQLVFQYLYKTQYILHYPHLIYISEPLNALCGVLIFLYFRNIYNAKMVASRHDILFILPFICYLGYYLPFYLKTADAKISELRIFYEATIAWNENLAEWLWEILINIPFLYASWLLLRKYQTKIKDEFANIEMISYETARNLLYIIMLLYVFELLTIILALFKPNWAETTSFFLYILNISVAYLIGYDALVRTKTETVSTIFNPTDEALPLNLEIIPSSDSPTSKYQKSGLSEEKANKIAAKIIKCMEEETLYRNPNLKLTDLVEIIQENSNNISQVINDIFKQNFYDLVNNYRVEEAKHRLKSPTYDHYNIVAIGLEVGFNSKSTFYTAFKKNTNMTPIQYKKS